MIDDKYMDLSNKIRKRREELGLTLEDVGKYIGVTKGTVNKYESGEIKNLKQGTIEKLAEVLKLSPAYLMGWEEKITTPFETLLKRFENKNLTTEEIKEITKFIEYTISKRD